jgi:ABC-type glycerol-3-phosphate transport system substrate-binding protein
MSKENMMKGLARVLLFAVMLSLGVLLTACGGSTASPTATPSATSPAPMTVTVTLTDFKIASDLTQFQVGVPYHFVVINQGATEHELMIAPPMTAG